MLFRTARRWALAAWTVVCAGPCPPVRAQSSVDVPLAVAAGPALFRPGLLSGDSGWTEGGFAGLRIDVGAVLGREFLARNMGRVPEHYRAWLARTDEVRVGSLYIPESLILAQGNTSSMFGATWSPIGTRMPLSDGPIQLDLNARLVLTLARLETPGSGAGDPRVVTTFARPGLALGASVSLLLRQELRLRAGWDEAFYVPQGIGAGLGEVASSRGALWRLGAPWIMLEWRGPIRMVLPG